MGYPNITQDVSTLLDNVSSLLNRVSNLEKEKVATSNLLNLVYPVGSIYMSMNNVSPSTFLGGTWEQIQDRFLLSAGAKSVGVTGGEESHVLTMSEAPNRLVRMIKNSTGKTLKGYSAISCPELGNKTVAHDGWAHVCAVDAPSYGFTEDITSNSPHNNMPPYLTVYMWKRIS